MARGRSGSFGGNPAEQLFLSFVELLEAQGVDLNAMPAPLRRLAKLDPRPFWASPLGAQAVQLGGAVLAKMTANPRIGLRLGVQMPFGARGIIDYLLRSASTPRQAFALSKRFQPLAFDYLTVSLREEGPRAALESVTLFELTMHPVLVDYRLTREVSFLRFLLGAPEWNPQEIHLAYPRPNSTQAYRQAFGDARLCFDAPNMGIWFGSDLLERALPQGDEQLCAILTQQAEQMLAKLTPKDITLAARLEELLMTLLAKGKPSSQQVARQLGMSERTLRRRLESEGVSYQVVLDRARAKLAKMYLDDPALGTQDVAKQLGFESGSSLRRAYERWTGNSLRERRQRRGEPPAVNRS